MNLNALLSLIATNPSLVVTAILNNIMPQATVNQLAAAMWAANINVYNATGDAHKALADDVFNHGMKHYLRSKIFGLDDILYLFDSTRTLLRNVANTAAASAITPASPAATASEADVLAALGMGTGLSTQ